MASKNHVENVAIVGAGGHQGEYIVASLLATGKHKVTAITRADSKNTLPSGIHVKKVNYDDPSSLTEALRGQDALVITMNAMAPPDTQIKLVDAAAAAGVPWVLPNEYGPDGTQESLNAETLIGVAKAKLRAHVEEVGKSAWIGIACNFWLEWSLAGGPDRFGFDIPNRKAIFYDDGTTSINTSTWEQVGHAVANLLSLPVSGSSVSLDSYRNKFVYISSFTLNQREMLAALQRATGTKDSDWTIQKEPVKEYYAKAVSDMKSGDRSGFSRALYSRVFYPTDEGNFGKRLGLDNEKLGLKQHDLDECVKHALKLKEKGVLSY